MARKLKKIGFFIGGAFVLQPVAEVVITVHDKAYVPTKRYFSEMWEWAEDEIAHLEKKKGN